MAKIIVLGAGMVGSAIALDLSTDHLVSVADRSQPALERVIKRNPLIKSIACDLGNVKELQQLLQPFDLVVCAVPGFMGYKTLEAIIESGKHVVDISFFPENAFALQPLAIERGVTAIVDCGVAPGMDNIILGRYNETMELTSFECLVGGLPLVKKWPFNYKAPFSPVDVIEEYTRPARYVENGNIITKAALSDVEHVFIDGVGTLESFNSDGLRSILFTMPHIPNLKEKTLRYPGHVAQIMALRDAGFFANEPIEINGTSISPLAFTSKVLFKEWKLGASEEELTVMRVNLEGKEKSTGLKQSITYNLHHTYDKSLQLSSMATSTGYTATAAANLILQGLFNEVGVFPPELIGKYEPCFQFILDYLAQRNIHYVKTVSAS